MKAITSENNGRKRHNPIRTQCRPGWLLLALAALSLTRPGHGQTLDAFNPGVSGGTYASASRFAVQTDGKVLVGGVFTQLAGQPCNSLGRVNPDGSLDTTFHCGVSTLSAVGGLAVQADGKILVAGEFTNLVGQLSDYFGRLNPDGSVDGSFKPGSDPGIYLQILQPDGKILVAGNFTTLAEQSRTNIARLNPDGSLDASFNPGAIPPPMAIALQADGKILVGDVGPSKPVIRLNPDGSLDASFTPTIRGVVDLLAVQADGKILAGASFASIQSQGQNNLVRLNADSSLDTSFHSPLDFSPDSPVSSLVVQADGRILLAINSFFARLNPDGSFDASFLLQTNGSPVSLALQADGKILAGGQFTTLGGQSRTNLGRLNNTSPATESLTFDASTITWLRGGTAPEAYGATFDYSTNGVDWTALGAGTRIAGGWQFSGLSLPDRAAVRARGWVAGGYYNGSSWFVETRAVTPPKLAALGVGTNGFRFTFESVAGATYVTETCDGPITGTWSTLEQRTGTGALEMVADPSPGEGTRFYRVRAVPPP